MVSAGEHVEHCLGQVVKSQSLMVRGEENREPSASNGYRVAALCLLFVDSGRVLTVSWAAAAPHLCQLRLSALAQPPLALYALRRGCNSVCPPARNGTAHE